MNSLKNIALVFCLVIIIASCKREDDFLGPELVIAESDFKLVDSLQATTLDVDFTNEQLVLKAKFSQVITWTLNLQGQASGATYVVKQTTDSLNVAWDGASNNVFHFRKGESVEAIITFLGTTISDTLNITINETKVFNGFLVTDFDGGGLVSTSWWQSFKPGELLEHAEKYSDIVVPQGSNCLHMKGIDTDPEGFLGQTGHSGVFEFGGVEFPVTNDSLYFNYYLQGKKGTRIEVRISQTVNGEFEGSEYSYFTNINWDGWQLISAPYSDFNRTGGLDVSPVKKAKLITRVKFVLRAVTNGDEAEANIDYPIFTIAKPFKQ